jgi:hypothetical protein
MFVDKEIGSATRNVVESAGQLAQPQAGCVADRKAATRIGPSLAAAFALAAALAGCGGGGGDAAVPSPVPAPPPASPPEVNPDLVTSVTAPTYAAGSTEKGAWDLLMQQRSACGFGLLQQDTRLDAAAAAHTNYLVRNSLERNLTVSGHNEEPTWNYFTGVTPDDRALHAGFTTGISEILHQVSAFQSSTLPAQLNAGEALGASTMRTLIETVYHARGAFLAGRAGGIGSTVLSGPSATAGINQTQFRLVTEVSRPATSLQQKLGTGKLATWPCAGLTAVRGTFAPATESPNPFPDVTDAEVKYGTPIYIKADEGSKLVVSAASVTKVSDGSALAIRQITQGNDPAGHLGANEVFLVPTSALAAGSSYAVNVTGTLNGTAFTKSFSFSTAP